MVTFCRRLPRASSSSATRRCQRNRGSCTGSEGDRRRSRGGCLGRLRCWRGSGVQSLTCCSGSDWPGRTDLCLQARTPSFAVAAVSTHPFSPAEGPDAGLCFVHESLPRHQVLRAGLHDGRGKWGDICSASHAPDEGGTGPERNRKDADGPPAAWVRRTASARQVVRPCCRIMPCCGVTEPDAHALSTQPQVTGACTSPMRGNCATISGMHADRKRQCKLARTASTRGIHLRSTAAAIRSFEDEP